MQPYVMSFQRSCGISGFVTKEMVAVVVASQRISSLKDRLRTFLCFGCFSRWQYSNKSPVSSSKMEWAQSHKNCNGNLRAEACWALGAAFVSIK